MNRVLIILGALVGRGPVSGVSLQDLAREVGMPQSTVHRILQVCVGHGVAMQVSDRRYSVGPMLLALGLSAVAEWGFGPVAQQHLRSLAADLDEECYLTMRAGEAGVFVERSSSSKPVKVVEPLFENLPLHCGASRKVLLAHTPEDFQREYLRRTDLQRFTSKTLVDSEALGKELDRIRRRGYAISIGERSEGVVGVAAPVVGPLGGVIASVAVLGPRATMTDRRIRAAIPKVRAVAGNIGESLAHALSSRQDRFEGSA